MLEVQIICPVEQIDHDERQGEGDSGVVVYVVRVLHVTAVYGAEHFTNGGQSSEAPVDGLRGRRLGLWLAARRAGGSDSELGGVRSGGGSRGGLLASLGSAGVRGDGGDDAVHIIVKVMHLVAVLLESSEK